MPAFVTDLKKTDDLRDTIHRAVEALAAGKIVALPTETVYGLAASALDEGAVQRLADIKGRDSSKPFSFAVKSDEDGLDYVPDMSKLARRIARRCWPGPVTLVLPDSHPDSVIKRLPEITRRFAVPTGSVGLRVPAHEVTLEIMRLMPGPLVLTSANIGGQPDAVTAEEVVTMLGDKIDLVLDDRACRYGQPSSVVRIENSEITFLREGVVDEKTLRQLSRFIAVVVCTGNTCRSPMGEAILKKRLAEKLGCTVNELVERGINVLSAGIHAMNGGRPAPQAVEVMSQLGMDIGSHSSQPVTNQLAHFADLILTMTNGHRQAILSQWPSVEPRIKTVRTDGADVSDPIGMPVEVYRSCAEQIDDNISRWIEQIEL